MRRVSTGVGWAREWGYSRAVRRGDLIEVSGTTAMLPDGTVVGPEDLLVQARYVFGVVLDAIEQLGGGVDDVVRTRVFLSDISQWRFAGQAHAEIFGQQLPASSGVGGVELLDPRLLIEVEATAYLSSETTR